MGAVSYPASQRTAPAAPGRGAPDQDIDTLTTPRVCWRVARSGSGPVVVLLHGTGSAGCSWSAVAERLARQATVIVPDLPGHGDSKVLDYGVMSLNGMARETGALLDALKLKPALVAGHSAGAALAVRMALDGYASSPRLVSVNGAFATFGGILDRVFAPLAGLCASSSLVTGALARKARDIDAVRRIIESTGSRLDRGGLLRYSRLLQDPVRLEAMFAMMANWDLRTLRRDLPKLDVPLHLVVADNDKAVDPRQAADVASRCRHATITRLARVGHLAHEEAPEQVAELMLQDLQQCGVQ